MITKKQQFWKEYKMISKDYEEVSCKYCKDIINDFGNVVDYIFDDEEVVIEKNKLYMRDDNNNLIALENVDKKVLIELLEKNGFVKQKTHFEK